MTEPKSTGEQLMMVWRNPYTGEIYYPASYMELLRIPTAEEYVLFREAYAETYPVRPLLNAIDAKDAEIERLKAELKKLDPDPVVCGCREALCPHTPIAQLPRQELVKYYKERIHYLTGCVRDLTAALEKRDG